MGCSRKAAAFLTDLVVGLDKGELRQRSMASNILIFPSAGEAAPYLTGHRLPLPSRGRSNVVSMTGSVSTRGPFGTRAEASVGAGREVGDRRGVLKSLA